MPDISGSNSNKNVTSLAAWLLDGTNQLSNTVRNASPVKLLSTLNNISHMAADVTDCGPV